MTHDAITIMNRRFGNDPQARIEIERYKQDMEVAELIHEARTAAGLTQAGLARKVGTTQSVISKLESADYDGHSLTMLRRIAAALGMRVRIAFVPDQEAA